MEDLRWRQGVVYGLRGGRREVAGRGGAEGGREARVQGVRGRGRDEGGEGMEGGCGEAIG